MYIYNGLNIAIPNASAQALTSATAIYSAPVVQRVLIKKLMFVVSTTVSSSASAVLTYYWRPNAGSATGQVTLGTITIPTASAAGKVFVNNITPFNGVVGGDIAVSVTTAATSAGGGFCSFYLEQDPETDKNESSVTVVTV